MPWYEPHMDGLITELGGKMLEATMDHSRAITETDVTIILTATPSNPDGSFSNRYIEDALLILARILKESSKPDHLFIISSTVMPGSIEGSFIPLLERVSGRSLNRGFGVGYDPDFVALGNVVIGFLKPDLVVIGQSSEEVGNRIKAIHSELYVDYPAHVARMSIKSAEITKVCLNAYITMKISFANIIGNLCGRIPDTDPDDITRAIGADRRISPFYLQAGPAFGGTCFGRDTKAFHALMLQYKLYPQLMDTVDTINKQQDHDLTNAVQRQLSKISVTDPTIGILGLAFTDNTPVIVESPGIKLLARLLLNDYSVAIYDPLAMDNVRALYENGVTYCKDVAECLSMSHICVLALRSVELKKAIESYSFDNPVILIDCWRYIDRQKIRGNITYIPMGKVS